MSGNRTIQSSPFTTLKDELIDVHHSSLYLGQLCLSWEHHDVVITSSEGTKIPAHKLILLSRSDYFKNMFASSVYSDENPVILPYSTECIKQILRFLYSGKINLMACHFRVLLELMDASRMMLMYSVSEDERGGIADYIEYYIIAQLFGIPEDDYYTDDEEEADVDRVRRCRSLWELKYGDKDYTAVEILNYSIANVFPTLMNASICFLKDIALQFLWRQSFFNLSFPALSELLKLDALADSAEVGIFSAVERWLNFSPDHMDQKVRILQLIRFDQMSVTEMFHTVKPSGLLESKEFLDIVVCIINNKDELKVENGRHIIGRRGCMEKVSQVPMWIREISITTSQRCVFMGSTLDYWRTPWTAQILYTENSQLKIPDKSLTELGFSLQLLNGGYKEDDDEDYIPEEDSELETDSSTDDEDGTEDDEDGIEVGEDGIEVGEEDGKSGLETDFSTDNEDEIEEDKEDWKAGLETDTSTDGEHEIEVGEEDLKTALETNSSTDDKNEIEVDEEDRKAVMETNSSTDDKNEIEMGEEDLKAGLETNSPTDDDESEVDEEDWKAAMETNSLTDDEDEIEMGKEDWKAGLESDSPTDDEDDSCYQAFTSFVFGNNSPTDDEDEIEMGEEDLKAGLESDSSTDKDDIEEGEEDGLPRLESDSSTDKEDDIEEGEEDLKGGLEYSIDDLFQSLEELDDYIKQRDLL